MVEVADQARLFSLYELRLRGATSSELALVFGAARRLVAANRLRRVRCLAQGWRAEVQSRGLNVKLRCKQGKLLYLTGIWNRAAISRHCSAL
jgi:hypothetical protein